MIKKPAVEVRRVDNDTKILPRKQRPSRFHNWAVLTAATVVASVAAYIIGAHLHRWVPHRPSPHIVDASIVNVLPSSTAATTIVRTPDGRVLILTSDLGPTTTIPLLQSLKEKHVLSISGIILTSVTPNTAAGIVTLKQHLLISGPVIDPFPSVDQQVWWSRTRHNFAQLLKEHGLHVTSWQNSQPLLQTFLPEANISFYAPAESRWEAPSIATRVAYGDSSLIDLTSLSASQVAAITGTPIGGSCRVLLVNGQDEFVSKELLAQMQPDVVILTGSQDIPAGDHALDNVKAADATALSLTAGSSISLSLPNSYDNPVLNAK